MKRQDIISVLRTVNGLDISLPGNFSVKWYPRGHSLVKWRTEGALTWVNVHFFHSFGQSFDEIMHFLTSLEAGHEDYRKLSSVVPHHCGEVISMTIQFLGGARNVTRGDRKICQRMSINSGAGASKCKILCTVLEERVLVLWCTDLEWTHLRFRKWFMIVAENFWWYLDVA